MNSTLSSPALPAVTLPQPSSPNPTRPGSAAKPVIGRAGFERVRKPVALLCVGAWIYAALRFPVLHGGGVEWVALLGHLLVAGAVSGRIWSTLHIGGHKNGRLCRSGPYARSRNPLYFFSWLGVTGLALVFREPWLVPLAWVAFWVSFAPLVWAEEKRLALLFGADFTRYKAEVPRFFPRLGAMEETDETESQTPGKLPQIERSLADALWFLIAAALIETLITNHAWEKLQVVVR